VDQYLKLYCQLLRLYAPHSLHGVISILHPEESEPLFRQNLPFIECVLALKALTDAASDAETFKFGNRKLAAAAFYWVFDDGKLLVFQLQKFLYSWI
jgi:Mg2+/Co2+ transporter CorB